MKSKFRVPRTDFQYMKGFKRLNGAIFSLSYGVIPYRKGGVAIVISSKNIRRAVDRNRIKRLCRAVFSRFCEHVDPQYVYVFIAKKHAKEADSKEIRADLDTLLSKAR